MTAPRLIEADAEPKRFSSSLAPIHRTPVRASVSPVELATLHSLTWLVVANGVGLLLATLLLLPDLGLVLGPLTYGRWVPVHLDLHLYGWCSLPLVALLLRAFGSDAADAPPAARRLATWALSAWSASLVVGSFNWLSGHSSGKLFLEWTGSGRLLFCASLGLLALALSYLYGSEVRRVVRRRLERRPRALEENLPAPADLTSLIGHGLVLLMLLPVPFVLYWASSPQVYPPHNPDSSGATGTSLLGSSLGIVLVFCLTPILAGRRPHSPRVVRQTFILLALHFGAFFVLDHGSHSHHELPQILALASLVVWPPLLIRYFRALPWPPESRRWLIALALWGGLLVATGVLQFLPGALEAVKFTNALVAHAHLAMASVTTSFLFATLILLHPDTRLARALGERHTFWAWHAGSVLLLGSLVAVAALEVSDHGVLFAADWRVFSFYALRWLGGGLMLWASAQWLTSSLQQWAFEERERREERTAGALS